MVLFDKLRSDPWFSLLIRSSFTSNVFWCNVIFIIYSLVPYHISTLNIIIYICCQMINRIQNKSCIHYIGVCTVYIYYVSINTNTCMCIYLRKKIVIYIYAFRRRFYPRRLTVHSDYTFFVSMCFPWELNPPHFALLLQCSTTEPQEHIYLI